MFKFNFIISLQGLEESIDSIRLGYPCGYYGQRLPPCGIYSIYFYLNLRIFDQHLLQQTEPSHFLHRRRILELKSRVIRVLINVLTAKMHGGQD